MVFKMKKEKKITGKKINSNILKKQQTKKELINIKIKDIFNISNCKKVLTVFNNEVILFFIYIMTIEILFKIFTDTFSFNYSLIRIAISSTLVSLLAYGIKKLISNKVLKKVFMIILSFAIMIYSLAQLGFYKFLGNYASLNTSSQLGKVTDYFGEFIHSFKSRYYIVMIPFILLGIYLVKKREENNKINIKKYSISIIGLVIMYILTLNVTFMQNKFQYVTNKELFSNPTLPNVSVNQFGISVFGILDIKSKILGQSSTMNLQSSNEETTRTIDDEQINKIISQETDQTMNALNKYFYSQKVTETNEFTGYLENKNVIFIMLESVNTLMDNQEYFPTLSKLYNEGMTFTNNYSPRNNCSTGNNEFSAMTSLYTINNVCSANEYKNNTYFESIFNLFKNKGYDVSSFHNYTEKYYYRKTIHANLGSTYYGVDELGIEYSNKYGVWPSDVELMEKSFNIFANSDKEKFMTLLTTVTTHQPYTISSEYGDKYLDMFTDLDVSISVKRYLSKMVELDKALEKLMELLEEKGILDDTVLVMFGDHYPYGLKTSELQEMFTSNLEDRKEIEKTPFIIYNSEIPAKKYDNYTTYINILPTVANLFNLDYDPRLYVGEDLFSSSYSNMAIFADGSWQSKYAYYDAESSKITYIKDGYKYTDEEIIEINGIINDKITMSNLAITKNYFNYLEKKLNPTLAEEPEEVITPVETGLSN